MTWRFRKSFSPLPGVRLTLSPRGISTSVEVGSIPLTSGLHNPGSGISFCQNLGNGNNQRASAVDIPEFKPQQPALTSTLIDIKSASSDVLTTAGLTEFKTILECSCVEHGEISRELEKWRIQEAKAIRNFKDWESGWLFRRIFKEKFKSLWAAAENAIAHRAELEEQKQLSRLKIQLELPPSVAQAFHSFCDEFSLMSKSQRIWDSIGQRATNRIVERTTASRVIDRKPVSFHLGKCELIDSNWTVPHLENANGGDIYFYPAFILYFVTSNSFALIEYKEININFTIVLLIEENPIPSDSKIVGNTWAKANKDGSPDKRFKINYQIPIARYGKLLITSKTGLNEEYMISNVENTESFAKAWATLAHAVNIAI